MIALRRERGILFFFNKPEVDVAPFLSLPPPALCTFLRRYCCPASCAGSSWLFFEYTL